LVGLATILQTLIHPGMFFPALATYGERKKMRREIDGSGSSVEKPTSSV
jgi:hypothetical protein